MWNKNVILAYHSTIQALQGEHDKRTWHLTLSKNPEKKIRHFTTIFGSNILTQLPQLVKSVG